LSAEPATREGGCLCRAVRYRVHGEPEASGICHCETCRRIASAPSLPFVVFRSEQFAIIRGWPVEFRSSPPVTRSFCGTCGSPLTYRNAEGAGRIDIMTCSLDDAQAFTPTFHVGASDKLDWEPVSNGLPVYLTTRKAGRVSSS
jgi:hypothetical protein